MLCYLWCKYQKRRWKNVSVTARVLKLYEWPSYFVSALYLSNPWRDLQITLHKCQVWWDNVQCLCLTKIGSRSRSQFKYIFWTPGGFSKLFCTNVSYDKTMCSAYLWPRSVQDKGHSLRFKIVLLFFVPAFYLLNAWWD